VIFSAGNKIIFTLRKVWNTSSSTCVYTNISGTKNSSLFLKLNIPFGVGEETKKEIKRQKELLKEKKLKRKEAKKKNKQ